MKTNLRYQKLILNSISLLFPIVMSTSAVAHPLDVVYAEVKQETPSELTSCISVHPDMLKKILEPKAISEDVLKENIFFEISAAEKFCVSEFDSLNHGETSERICYRMKCPNQETSILFKFNFTSDMDEKFVVLGKFLNHGAERIFKVDRASPSTAFTAPAPGFFVLGMDHIGATPAAWTAEDGSLQLADGIDHVLFVLVLLLISSSWKRLLINITGFTVGHSVTLVLALTGVLSISAAVIEPAIAMTIAWVALCGVLNRKDESVWITVVFGLLHGMGFSYVLGALDTSDTGEFLRTLLLFNVGIEAGQLVIVALLSPLLFYILAKKPYARQIAAGLSTIIFLLSIYWVIERTFLS